MKWEKLVVYGLAVLIGFLIAKCLPEGITNTGSGTGSGESQTRGRAWMSLLLGAGSGTNGTCDPKRGGCSFNGCTTCDTGWCSASKVNCEGRCSGTWCPGTDPTPPPLPPTPPCTGSEPCPVPYTKCPSPLFSDDLISKVVAKNSPFLKVVYVSAWTLQEGKQVWLEHFTKLITAGYNVIILSFIPQEDKTMTIPNWASLSCADKHELKQYLVENKAMLLISIGGGGAPQPTEGCKFNWIDTKADTGENYIAEYAYHNMFDGVDFDLEWFSMGVNNPACGDKLAGQAKVVRDYYGRQNQKCVITSAPQTPYFTKDEYVIDYIDMDLRYPDAFDVYNIQFYNNEEGATKEKTIGSETVPRTVLYMIHRGLPKHKIVLGKCGKGGDCCKPKYYVDGRTLISWANEQHLQGVMYWSSAGGCDPEADMWLKGPH